MNKLQTITASNGVAWDVYVGEDVDTGARLYNVVLASLPAPVHGYTEIEWALLQHGFSAAEIAAIEKDISHEG